MRGLAILLVFGIVASIAAPANASSSPSISRSPQGTLGGQRTQGPCSGQHGHSQATPEPCEGGSGSGGGAAGGQTSPTPVPTGTRGGGHGSSGSGSGGSGSPGAGPSGRPNPTATSGPTATSSSTSGAQPAVSIDNFELLGVNGGGPQREPVVHLRQLIVFVVQFHETAGRKHFPSGGLRLTKAARTLYRTHLKLGTWIDGSPILYRALRFNSKRYLGHLVAHITLKLKSAKVSRSLNLIVQRRVRSY